MPSSAPLGGPYIHEAIFLIRLNHSRPQKNSQDLFINALKFPVYNIRLAQMNLTHITFQNLAQQERQGLLIHQANIVRKR